TSARRLSRSLAIRPPVVQRGIQNQERGDRLHIDRGGRTADGSPRRLPPLRRPLQRRPQQGAASPMLPFFIRDRVPQLRGNGRAGPGVDDLFLGPPAFFGGLTDRRSAS